MSSIVGQIGFRPRPPRPSLREKPFCHHRQPIALSAELPLLNIRHAKYMTLETRVRLEDDWKRWKFNNSLQKHGFFEPKDHEDEEARAILSCLDDITGTERLRREFLERYNMRLPEEERRANEVNLARFPGFTLRWDGSLDYHTCKKSRRKFEKVAKGCAIM